MKDARERDAESEYDAFTRTGRSSDHVAAPR